MRVCVCALWGTDGGRRNGLVLGENLSVDDPFVRLFKFVVRTLLEVSGESLVVLYSQVRRYVMEKSRRACAGYRSLDAALWSNGRVKDGDRRMEPEGVVGL